MKVLIIEDSLPMARVLATFVEPLTDEIIITTELRKALDIMEKAGPIELITLDLSLPDSPSWDTLRAIPKIREKQPDSLLVIVTGQEIQSIKEQAAQAGADGVVLKQAGEFTPQGFIMMLNVIVHQCLKAPRHFSKSVSTLEIVAKRLCALIPQPQA